MSDRIVLTDEERRQVLEALRRVGEISRVEWGAGVLGVTVESMIGGFVDAVVEAINDVRGLPRGTVKVDGAGDDWRVAVKIVRDGDKEWFVHPGAFWESDEYVADWRVVYQPGEQQ